MKQQTQQYFLSSTYLPIVSADIVSKDTTKVQIQNQNINKSMNNFNQLNSMIEEFNKEFFQNNTTKNINLNDSNRHSLNDSFGGNNILTEPKENEGKFYKTSARQNSISQLHNNIPNNFLSINNQNEPILLKQLKRKEILLNKAHDIINHFRTDIQMDQLAQQVNQKIQSQLNHSSSLIQNQCNVPLHNMSEISNNSIQSGQRKRNKSQYTNCTSNSSFQLKNKAQLSYYSVDLELQDKLFQSNKNLQENIIKLNEANKMIKILQDQEIKNLDQIEDYQKQYQNVKQKLKLSLKKLKELKDRESQRETDILTIIQNYDSSVKKLETLGVSQHHFQQIIKQQHNNDEKKELEKKLQATIKYNEDLFQNYSNILKVNQELQNKILEQEQENLVISEQLKEFRKQMNMLKQTEHKVENLEHNISRIEEVSTLTVPELQKKVKQIEEENTQNIEILGYCTEFVEAQLNKTVLGLYKILQDTNISLIGQKNCLEFSELRGTSNLTKGLDMKRIIQKLDVSSQLQQIIQYVCTISYAIAHEQINNTVQPLIESLDRKILLVETLIPKFRSYIIQKKAENNLFKKSNCFESLSETFVKHKSQKISLNQKKEMTKFSAQSRQSLSFQKEIFDEFSNQNQENADDFSNIQRQQKDPFQMNMITNSMSSNHLFKIHDTPEKKNDDEQGQLNIKLLQIVNAGIKKYEDLSNQMNLIHQKSEILYKTLQQNNSFENTTKGETQKLFNTNITLSKKIQLSELFIKKELGVIKAEIKYHLKLQRQMELPKMM